MTEIEKKFLSKADLVKIFGLKDVDTINKMVKRGQLPNPVRIGNLVRWPMKVVDDFIANANKAIDIAEKQRKDGLKLGDGSKDR